MFGGSSATQKLQQTLNTRISFVRLVLSEAVGLDRAALLTFQGQVSSVTAGALVTSPPYIRTPELLSLWNDMWSNRTSFENQAAKIPWLNAYLSQLTKGQCSVNGANWPSCWQLQEQTRTTQIIQEGKELNLYTGYQVKATAIMTASLKRLHDDTCGSSNSGLCTRLRNTISNRTGILDSLRQSTFDLRNFSSVSEAFANTSSVRFNETDGNIVSGGSEADYDVFNFRRNGQGEFNFEMVKIYLLFYILISVCSFFSSE